MTRTPAATPDPARHAVGSLVTLNPDHALADPTLPPGPWLVRAAPGAGRALYDVTHLGTGMRACGTHDQFLPYDDDTAPAPLRVGALCRVAAGYLPPADGVYVVIGTNARGYQIIPVGGTSDDHLFGGMPRQALTEIDPAAAAAALTAL